MISVRFALMVGLVACVALPSMGQTSERERLRRDRDMSVYRGGVDGGDAARLYQLSVAERVDSRRISAQPLVGSVRVADVRPAVYVADVAQAPVVQPRPSVQVVRNPVIYPEDRQAYSSQANQVQTQAVTSYGGGGSVQLASHSSFSGSRVRVGVGFSDGGTSIALGYSNGYGRGYGYPGYGYRRYYGVSYGYGYGYYPAPYYCPQPVVYYAPSYYCPPPVACYRPSYYCGPSFGIGFRSGFGHRSGLSLFFSTRF